MHKTSIEDAETGYPARNSISASGPPLAGAVVLSFPFNRDAAAYPVDDANVLDEDVFELGTLAVRLVGAFSLPRLRVLTQDLREGAYRDPGSSDR